MQTFQVIYDNLFETILETVGPELKELLGQSRQIKKLIKKGGSHQIFTVLPLFMVSFVPNTQFLNDEPLQNALDYSYVNTITILT